ncbi:MAG: endo alpha-1,4 polygalactosaminidase [Planctomycetes bacterium]|nr:endo alpha-1,4 polygalactosaminidase [Planctomycetota bacterium]
MNDFAIWLQKMDPVALGKSHFDLCIVDADALSPAEVARLQRSPGGPKIVLAYLSIGEAENYRAYWRPQWKEQPPDWLGPENPDWPGNYKVRYWDPAWQAIVLACLERIVAAGFDGVYLDVVDAYEFWEEAAARERMIEWVLALAGRAKASRPGFLIFPQNADELLEDARYLAAIDGVGREETYFMGGKRHREKQIELTERRLDRAVAAGKKALLIEYLVDEEAIAWVHGRARRKGYAVYVADRLLDGLRITPGHEPD